MGKYYISGVWKNSNDVITHYLFHKTENNSISDSGKKSKSEAIRLLENRLNSAQTIVWNYKTSQWNIGENVTVVNGRFGKFLRSNPDKTETDNLGHLINFSIIQF